MAFFRFNRDKRGYEHFYLVEPVTNRRGKSQPRVLYWYRTPPNIRVGRAPFDEAVQRALEAQNPTVTFDWRKIIDAPIPSADAEKWRERRRVERAEKAARQMTATVDEPVDEIVEGPSPIGDLDAAPPPDAPAPMAPPAGGTADPVRKRRRRRRGRGARVDATPVSPARSAADAITQEPVEPAAPAEGIEPSNPTEPLGD
jgi:hypothetical protein